MSESPLARALGEAGVLVCVGTGGVGKTTVAAALALEAARRGRRTLALTVDPARRLANAFGLASLPPEPVRVPLDPDDAAHSNDTPRPGESGEGFLEITMLSTRHAFDAWVERLTRDPAIRRRILDNRIYHHLAESLAGSLEYAAMAEVQALVESGRYDLVVVDTPPAEHALDFLRAPGRLRAFLESRFFQALVRPAMSASRFSFRLFARPVHHALALLERIAGIGFLDDLGDLLRSLDGLSTELDRRARAAQAVLFGSTTRFVLVSRALAGSERTTPALLEEMLEIGAPLAAVVANRLTPWPAAGSPERLRERAQGDALEADIARLASGLGIRFREAAAHASAEAAPIAVESASESETHAAARNIAEAILEAAQACALERGRLRVLAAEARAHGLSCVAVEERPESLDHAAALAAIAHQLLQSTTPRAPEAGPQ